ncbi:hypothetical protein G7046_g8875 [Stylonectria norvegica]|nr:hypothetical protein G7046_g8875 [Stylonectria norvegica]
MSSKLVFITGSTGFIGAHVVAATLAAGYRIRLSVRKPEQEQAIKDRYSSLSSRVETLIVPDITDSKAFIDALRGVDFVFHIASPMPGAGNDFGKDYVKPAVDGTLAILDAALDHSSIKKIIVDSSALALLPIDALGRNDIQVRGDVKELAAVKIDTPFPDGMAGTGMRYAGSKILAHQATKDWIKKNQPHFILNTLHATFVLGKDLNQKNAEGLTGINNLFWLSLFSEKPLIPGAWVHVEDVADAHIEAIETDTGRGQGFVLSQPSTNWDEAVKIINQKYADLGCKIVTPLRADWTAEVSETEKVLKLNWKSMENILSDVIDQQLAFKK